MDPIRDKWLPELDLSRLVVEIAEIQEVSRFDISFPDRMGGSGKIKNGLADDGELPSADSRDTIHLVVSRET